VPKSGGVDQDGDVVLNGTVVWTHVPCAYPPIKSYHTEASVQIKPHPDNGTTCSTTGPWNPWSEGALQCSPTGGTGGWDGIQALIYVPTSAQTPEDTGALLYYWTGISDPEGGDIDTETESGGLYQSVLQWGYNGAEGNSDGWTISSWYVLDGDAYPGTYYDASPGDVIGTDVYADYSFGNGAYIYNIDTQNENTGDDSTNDAVSNIPLCRRCSRGTTLRIATTSRTTT
jgi:hypothetical protein